MAKNKKKGSGDDFESFVRETLKTLSKQVGDVVTGQKNLDKKFDKLDTKVKANTKAITEIEKSLEFQGKRIDSTEEVTQKVSSDVEAYTTKISDMSKSAEQMQTQINSLERYTRSFNLRFLNIKETEGENCREVLGNLLDTHLGISGDTIENAHRTGKKPENGPRQLIARFHSRIHRNQVIRSARNLDPRPPFIVVDDLTPADLEEKRRLKPLMEKLYREGKRPRFFAGRLYAGNRVLNERTIAQLLEQVNNIESPHVSDEEAD